MENPVRMESPRPCRQRGFSRIAIIFILPFLFACSLPPAPDESSDLPKGGVEIDVDPRQGRQVVPIDRLIGTAGGTGGLVIILDTVELLSDGRVEVNVTYINNADFPNALICPSDRLAEAFLILPDGSVLTPLDCYCASRPGEIWTLAPGEVLHSWAIFGPLPDLSRSFGLDWYRWGKLENILLVR